MKVTLSLILWISAALLVNPVAFAVDLNQARLTDLRIRLLTGRPLPSDLSPSEQEYVRQQRELLKNNPKSKVDYKEQAFGIKEAKAPTSGTFQPRSEAHSAMPLPSEAAAPSTLNVQGSAADFRSRIKTDPPVSRIESNNTVERENDLQQRLRAVFLKQQSPYR
ncbi:MAG: hypothetical protein ACO4AU_13065 [bacterium]|jgi:hypothetical protein